MRAGRRQVLAAGAALGASAMFPLRGVLAQSADPIKIGMIDPMTGTYAGVGANEFNGARLAVETINAAGGTLGRPLQLLMEDSATQVGQSVQKARKLMDSDKVDMIMGAVSSAVALALSQTTAESGMIYMGTGGHSDSLTGADCRWNTFRVCNSTWMLSAGNARTVFDKYGGNWYFITPDYAFGHTLFDNYKRLLGDFGGKVLGNALAPLGNTDFSSYLIKAKAARPDVLMVLVAGDDYTNCIKQAEQFGILDNTPIAGGLMELEGIIALPPAARRGLFTMEWWWDQPDVPHVKEFVEAYRKNFKDYPTARSWFGYAGVYSLALAAAEAKSTDSRKVAKALDGFVLPPEVALQPNKCFFRAEDHQMLANSFPGEMISDQDYPNLFKVADVIPGVDIELSPEEKQCKMTWPA